MYWLKENTIIDFGIVKKYSIAKRIGITMPTLSKILNRKTGCSKALANYISLLNYKGTRYNDSHINDFFEEGK